MKRPFWETLSKLPNVLRTKEMFCFGYSVLFDCALFIVVVLIEFKYRPAFRAESLEVVLYL